MKTRNSAVLGLCLLVGGGALTGLAISAPATAADDVPLVGATTSWRYLQNDTFPGGAEPLSWTLPQFDDAAWLSGSGTFGGKISSGVQSPVYDAANTATNQLEMNAPGASTRVRTYFFRADFELSPQQIADIAVVRGKLSFDDGAVVYVNGQEVGRHDVAVGQEGLNYAPGGTTSMDSLNLAFGPEVLVPGTNTIAVEVHNDRDSSSDIWFGLDSLEAFGADEAGLAPTRIILTPTEDPSTSQNVTFQGGEPDDVRGRIQFRTEGGPIRAVNAPIQAKAASNDYGHFSGTLTGLKPATDYQYRVAADGVWSEWQQFTTEDPNATDFSYLYYGDAQIGLNTTWPKVVQQALAKAPDAVGSVHAGDLIDTGGNDAQWQDWFAGMKTAAATTNVMAAPGNHEYSGDKLLTSWKAHFEYPHNNPNESTIGDLALRAVGGTPTAKQYRAFFDHWSDFAAETVYFTDYQGVRFITVNATRDSTFLTPDSLPACAAADCPAANISALWTQYQAQWLDYVLANSESKWNVVTFHQPVYSTSAGRDEKVLRDYWVPVFEKHDIDLVQMGHDHTYARGYKNTTATDVPGRTDGPVYIVSNSGAKHYDLETDAKNVWINNGATQVQKAQDVTTYQVIDVSKDKLTYRSYIAEINGSGTYYRNGQLLDAAQFEVGDLWDEFTVYKTDDGRKAVQEAEMAAPEFEDLTQTPELTTQPKALVKATHGDDVTLTVAAQADGELTYAWQRRPLAGGTWQDLRREDEASLLLEHVTPATARYEYRVAVSNGSKTVHSDASRIQVSKRKATITVAKANLKRGKAATVKVRADVAGRVQIVLTHGATTRLKSVKVTAGKTVTVKLGKLARKGGPKKASVALTLLADDEGYAVTRATQKVALKR